MSDITKCRGWGCPERWRCYRYTAVPDEYRQSWFMQVPFTGKGCDQYWPLDKEVYNEKENKEEAAQEGLHGESGSDLKERSTAGDDPDEGTEERGVHEDIPVPDMQEVPSDEPEV